MKKIMLLTLFSLFSLSLFSASLTPGMTAKLKSTKYPKTIEFTDMQMADAVNVLGYVYNIKISAAANVNPLSVSLMTAPNDSAYDVLEMIAKQLNLGLSDTGKNGVVFQLAGNAVSGSAVESTQYITGEIVNYYGKGVANVKLKFGDSPEATVTTDKFGVYKIYGLLSGEYIVRVSGDNYNPISELVTYDGKQQRLNFNIGKPIVTVTNITTDSGINKEIGIVKDSDGGFDSTKILYVNNTDIEGVNTILKELLPNLTTIVDTKNNLIILKGNATDIKTAIAVAENLDKNIKQVLIKAKIIDITSTLANSLGFNWSAKDGSNAIQLLGGASGLTPPVGTLGFIFQRGGFSGSFNLLNTVEDSSVVSAPNIMVVNGEPANIDVVENRVVGTKTTTDPNTGIVTTEPMYGTAGTTLKVTPLIKSDGTIILTVNTNLSTFVLTDSGVIGQPNISTKGSTADTTVRVKDGETIVIGGLEHSEDTINNESVPVLSSMPLIGNLFKSSDKKQITRKIFIEITPEIVSLSK